MSISVVIPAYNEEVSLAVCLDSLRKQTLEPYEIIVVNNNSTDSTCEVAHSYGATVISEEKQGIMPAMYAGMSATSGEIIARCDADSVVPPDWLETINSELNKHPNAVGITGPGNFYGTNQIFAFLAKFWYMYAYFLLVGGALANWPLFGSNCALRRSTWLTVANSVHRNQSNIHDDMDISIHILPTQKILFLPSLTVGISARSLRLKGMTKRYQWGLRTLSMHWPAQSPLNRWNLKLSGDNGSH